MKRILVLITVLMLALSAWPADKDVSAHKEKKKNLKSHRVLKYC
ncbi:hypothetical protein RKD52_002969 [Metabacillus sp. SLBN-84]